MCQAELVAAQNEIRSANVGRLKAQETLRESIPETCRAAS